MASQTIVGDDLQYTQDNKHCYAFSGAISVGQETKKAFLFVTDSGYILAKLFFTYDITGFSAGEEIGYEVKLNDEQVVDAVYGGNITSPTTNVYQLEILLPPFTKTAINFISTDATGINMTMILTGRVFEALAVRN